MLIGIVLISLISFGLGRISISLTSSDEQVKIIENNLFKAQIGESIKNQNLDSFVGSKNSDKYHLPDCTWAKRIKKENQIWFSSAEDAKNQGYNPGSCIPHK